jgi:DNA-binding beta-propeller fold protein YncE
MSDMIRRKKRSIYVAYGGDEGGGIAVIDAASSKRLDDVAKLDAHPESFHISSSKPTIYAYIATKAKIIVIDRATHKVTDWPLKTGKSNYPMALDEADHRLFVVTRRPAQVVVLVLAAVFRTTFAAISTVGLSILLGLATANVVGAVFLGGIGQSIASGSTAAKLAESPLDE